MGAGDRRDVGGCLQGERPVARRGVLSLERRTISDLCAFLSGRQLAIGSHPFLSFCRFLYLLRRNVGDYFPAFQLHFRMSHVFCNWNEGSSEGCSFYVLTSLHE